MIDKKDRFIVMSDVVTEMTARDIIEQVYEINQLDDKREKAKKKLKNDKYERKPIKMIVNSYGGNVYDGFAIIAAMETSRTPVHTYVFGSAMSMGLCIAMSGIKRYMHRYATLMYHEVSGMVWDKLEDHQRNVEEMKRLQEMMDKIIISRSKIKKTKLTQIRKQTSDWMISAEEAIQYKMIDGLVDSI